MSARRFLSVLLLAAVVLANASCRPRPTSSTSTASSVVEVAAATVSAPVPAVTEAAASVDAAQKSQQAAAAATEVAVPPESQAPPAPSIRLLMPSDDTIRVLLAAPGTESKMAKGPTQGEEHVKPPAERLAALASTYERLSRENRLLNPCQATCADPSVTPCQACDAFVMDRATTYALPVFTKAQIGALYQLVSLQGPVDVGQIYRLDSQKGLMIGGLLVYQDSAVKLNGRQSPPVGSYLVVLRRSEQGSEPDKFYAELWRADAEQPLVDDLWFLRDRYPPGGDYPSEPLEGGPFAHVSAAELCFSQGRYQWCLTIETPTVGEAQNAVIIEAAIGKLKADGLLPDDPAVNVASAMPGIQGSTAVSQCTAYLKDDQPRQCTADTVTASMDALVELEQATQMATAPTHNPGFELKGPVCELMAGIGVMEVLAPIPEEVYDADGTLVDLARGSYRLDLVRVLDPARNSQCSDAEAQTFWLAQFVQAGSLRMFYQYAVEVHASGPPATVDVLWPPELYEKEESSEVLLDRFLHSFCQSKDMNLGKCARTPVSQKAKRHYCFSKSKFGWCDIIGY